MSIESVNTGEVRNLNEEGTGVAERRVKDAQAALTIVNKIKEAALKRDNETARIQGLLDGNRPYSTEKLNQHARKWQSNVNFREGEGMITAALQPYYDIFSSSRYKMELQLDTGDPNESEKLGQKLTEEVDVVLDELDWFEDEMQGQLWDFVGFGRGHIFWRDEKGIEFDHVPHHQVRVLDGQSRDTRELDVMAVAEHKKVHELWNMAKSAGGWNRDAVLKAIATARSRSGEVGTHVDVVDIQRQINEGDLYLSSQADDIPINHLYVREFSGKISHYILVDDGVTTAAQNEENGAPEFLYEKQDRWEEWDHIFSSFWFKPRQNTWYGSHGLGKDVFQPVEVKNRLKNRAIDGAFMRSGLTLRAKSAQGLSRQAMAVVGGANVVHPDFEPIQANIFGNIDEVVAMDQLIENLLQSNHGVYRSKTEKPQGNPRTAQEVRLQFATQATLTMSAVARFYKQLDRFYKELWRRLRDYRPLRDRLKKMGFPAQHLDKVIRVVAMRQPGSGSPFMRQENMLALQPLVGSMPEVGRTRFLQDMAAANTDYRTALRYFPDPSLGEQPDHHVWMADQENHSMKDGVEPTMSANQNHVAHLGKHLEAAMSAIQAVQRGADPQGVIVFLDTAGIHATKHLQQLQGDPSREQAFRLLNQQWKQVADLTDAIRRQMDDIRREQAQARERSQAIDVETRSAMENAQRKMELEEDEARMKFRHAEEEHQQKMRIEAEEAARKAAEPAKKET